jgi:hypothetical protein
LPGASGNDGTTWCSTGRMTHLRRRFEVASKMLGFGPIDVPPLLRLMLFIIGVLILIRPEM